MCRPVLHSGEAREPVDPRRERPLVERLGVRGLPRFVGVHLGGVGHDHVERLLHFLPERIGLVRGQTLAAEHDRRLEIFLADVEELEAELLRVADPRRMVRADELAAALDVLARHQVGEADDPSADAVARFGDGDVIPPLRQLVSGGQSAEPAADDDCASRGGAGERRQAVAHQQCRGGAKRALEHLPARDAVGLPCLR